MGYPYVFIEAIVRINLFFNQPQSPVRKYPAGLNEQLNLQDKIIFDQNSFIKKQKSNLLFIEDCF